MAERIYPTMHEPAILSGRSTSMGKIGAKRSDQVRYELKKGFATPGHAADPPLPPPSVYGRPRRRSSDSCCYLLALFCTIVVFVFIALCITVLVLWIILRPKAPQYSVQNAYIASLNVTSRSGAPVTNVTELQTLNSPVLNTDIAFTITARNPNQKIGIHYNKIDIFAAYQGTTFAQSHVPPFYQGHEATTDVTSDMKATNAPLTDSEGTSLQTAISNNDIPLVANINVRVAVQVGSWKSPSVWIHVVCDVRVSPPTAPQGAKLLSKACRWKR